MAMEENRKLHVLFLPYFTPSHIINLVNAARLFAAQGVKVTILTTKHNAALFRSSIDRDSESGRDISIHNLKFPAAEMGIPEGIENFTAATTPEMVSKVYQAVALLRKPMEDFIQSLGPDCIFSDMFFPWTVDLTEKMKIPRIMFYGNSFMSHCVPHNLQQYEPHRQVSSDSEIFLVPGLPDRIEMKRSQLMDYMKKESPYGKIIKAVKESELRSFGLFFDSFYELEPQYADYYQMERGTKIWTVGPLFYLSNKGQTTNEINFTAEDSRLNWLHTQEPHKVLYVSFGSMAEFSDAQLNKIALALEGSNRPFFWVVRKTGNGEGNQHENWLPDGFEDRITKANKGLICRVWVPQPIILQHPAIGGFMSHCGWNSVLEAVTAGVPLITWPLFAEHFFNEKTVEILKVGVRVGWDHWNLTPTIKGPVVGSLQIERAIERLMCDSEETQAMRRRAKEMAVMAKKAVEVGGSSYKNLLSLIDDLKKTASGVNN